MLYGCNLLVFGGTGIPFGEASSNQLYVCNLNTRTWRHIECDGEFPIRVYGHVSRYGYGADNVKLSNYNEE